ncbi:MAG: paraquat-inducible protein A [Xanthomonadales bacterium]|nr:paraquat-inducible protein A [Xanthomonadales bacterium]
MAGLLVASGLALLAGLALPAFRIDRLGADPAVMSLPGGIVALARDGRAGLALLVALFSIAFPIAKLLTMAWIVRADYSARGLARLVAALGKWSMLDVFIVAILIGAARLRLLSELAPEPGIYWFAASVLLSMLASLTQTTGFPPASPGDDSPPGRHARTVGLLLSFLGLGLFVLALTLPLMQVRKWLFWDREYSILEGTLQMWREGEWVLPTVIGVFVIALPLCRYLAQLLVRLFGGSAPSVLARFTTALGKWAMWDVYALGLVITTAKLSSIASVDLRPGFWLLLAAIAVNLLDAALGSRAAHRAASPAR